jgi:DNA-binding beta-propeller fold protein YncE
MRIRLLLTSACVAIAALGAAVATGSPQDPPARDPAPRRLLYVATPGIRNYVEHGGVGVLVFDIDNGHRFVRRIETLPFAASVEPENVKGIAASAATGRLYVSTIKRVLAIDLRTGALLWNRTYEGGCDRLALSPDGRILFVPSLEGPHWHVIDAHTGDRIARLVTGSGAHNTVFGPDGREVYLAGLKSPFLSIADPQTHRVIRRVGPFGNVIRPFTINGGQTRCFVNVNDLLGFEVGDLESGRVLHRVEVAGFTKGRTKRHGCPSHGVALTPDERELWLTDAANSRVHVFDATLMPPVQIASVVVRDQPGWITFGLDGQYAYPSTGDVIDVRTRRVVATLTDEVGRAVQSEKMLEIDVTADGPVAAGDQFGIGRRRPRSPGSAALRPPARVERR